MQDDMEDASLLGDNSAIPLIGMGPPASEEELSLEEEPLIKQETIAYFVVAHT